MSVATLAPPPLTPPTIHLCQIFPHPPTHLQCHLAAQPSLPLSPWSALQLFLQEPDTRISHRHFSFTSFNFTETILQFVQTYLSVDCPLEDRFHLHNNQLCSFLLRSFLLDDTRRRPTPHDHVRSCRFSQLGWFGRNLWSFFKGWRRLMLRQWRPKNWVWFWNTEDYRLHWSHCSNRSPSHRPFV